jgi:beta-lactam-binding protein with PASTA domain
MSPEQQKIRTVRVYSILMVAVAILSVLLVIGVWVWFGKQTKEIGQVLIYNVK